MFHSIIAQTLYDIIAKNVGVRYCIVDENSRVFYNSSILITIFNRGDIWKLRGYLAPALAVYEDKRGRAGIL
jgi:hypothetical protein